jgi:hypothetical protein
MNSQAACSATAGTWAMCCTIRWKNHSQENSQVETADFFVFDKGLSLACEKKDEHFDVNRSEGTETG